jgi:hypothetical protein
MSTIEQRAVSVADFCHRYGVGLTKAYEILASRPGMARKSGKSTLVDLAEAERWFESLPSRERNPLPCGRGRNKAA